MERMQKEKGRSEQKFESNQQFLEQVRKKFLEAKSALPNENIFIIDGNQPPEKVFTDIKDILDKHFNC